MFILRGLKPTEKTFRRGLIDMELEYMDAPIMKSEVMKRLERFAIAVCSVAVSFTSWALLENYKTNQRILVILEAVQRNDARQDYEIAQIKGQMVTWDTLRRIELYLMGQDPNKRGEMVGRALSMELESRKEKIREKQ